MTATTKADIINNAYNRLRISGLTVQPTPEDIEVALQRLENMMAMLKSRNICAGYIFEEQPDPNSPTGVGIQFSDMMESNLAIRLAPDFGKEVPGALAAAAQASLATASGVSALNNIREIPYPSRQPRGAGNAYRYNRFSRFFPPTAEPPLGCATNVILLGDIQDYYEDFSAYLSNGEAISSFTITADDGLSLQASANNDPRIDYRIRADNNSTQGTYQQIKIVITTDSGRVETRLIDFDVRSSTTIGSIP